MTAIPKGASAEPGAKPKRGKSANIDFPLPVDNYPMSDFEVGETKGNDNFRRGAHGQVPISAKGPTRVPDEEPFIPTASDAGAVEKFGLARGKFGVNS